MYLQQFSLALSTNKGRLVPELVFIFDRHTGVCAVSGYLPDGQI